MLWVTWRQHRAELAAALALLVVVGVPLAVSGLAMHEEYRTGGIAACVADPAARAGCDRVVEQFVGRHAEWAGRLMSAAFVPLLVGAFVGAPLLAREFEHGTWRLAVSQSVSRRRWLAVKLSLVGCGAVLVTLGFSALVTWWRAPLDAIAGRMHSSAFVVSSPSVAAAAVFGFALGVCAGAVLRRTIAAMAATVAAFVAVRLWTEEYARPRYRPPLVRITEPGGPAQPATDWVVRDGWIDPAGHVLTEQEEAAIVREVYGGAQAVYGDGTPFERYLRDHGLRHYAEYHPDSGFWTFQLIEAAWFLGLSAVLFAVTAWVVRQRA